MLILFAIYATTTVLFLTICDRVHVNKIELCHEKVYFMACDNSELSDRIYKTTILHLSPSARGPTAKG